MLSKLQSQKEVGNVNQQQESDKVENKGELEPISKSIHPMVTRMRSGAIKHKPAYTGLT